MPSPRKLFFHNSTHFVTTSVEEGFMFPANPLITLIILKCIARAQQLHPVIIGDILIQATHLHIILTVIDPQDAADFMERFKAEAAHAINRLLGRKKRTVWCEGYDSPILPDIDTVIEKIAYTHANPSNDGLEDSIEKFPGFNTFELRKNAAKGKLSEGVRYHTYAVPRSAFFEIPKGELSQNEYKRIVRRITKHCTDTSFVVEPDGWMKATFGITSKKKRREINKRIVKKLRKAEQRNREVREAEGVPVVGAKSLQREAIGSPYTPKRTGKKMYVHCVDVDLRIEYIRKCKALVAAGRACLKRWRMGDMTARYPLGLFPPTGIRLAEPLVAFEW
jgi:REP element-mobilizing transposase RayT